MYSYGRRMRVGRRRLRVQPRFFIVLGAAILAVAALVLIFALRQRTYYILEGELTEDVSLSCVVVRDETVVAAEETGGVGFLVSEGAAVTLGEAVAEVYLSGYDAAAGDELYDLRAQIAAYIRSDILGDIVDSDLDAFDTQIAEKTDEAAQAVADGDRTLAATLRDELSALMAQREAYLRRNARQDDALEDLYAQEESLEESIASWTLTVDAPLSGLVSFSFDGCEHLLNAGTLPDITASALSSIVKNSDMQAVGQATRYTSLFRIVGTDKWYCVFETRASYGIVPGESYTLSLPAYGVSYACTALEDAAYAQNGVTVLQVDGSPDAVLNARLIDAVLTKDFYGTVVPQRALFTRGGAVGVYALDGDQKTFVEVEVLASAQGRALVRAAGDGSLYQGEPLLLK